jgi:hypothetical protein
MSRDDPADTDDRRFGVSRRAILASMSTLGAAGTMGLDRTTGVFGDEESFGIPGAPNVLQAGTLDLVVGWTVRYYDDVEGKPRTLSKKRATNEPGPIVRLADVKPGDVVGSTLRARVRDTPAFLGTWVRIRSNRDAGIVEPEDRVDGPEPNDSDGTTGGDLAGAINRVLWYAGRAETASKGHAIPENDDGTDGARRDEFLAEIWTGDADLTDRPGFLAELGAADHPDDAFDTNHDLVVHSGTLADLSGRTTVLDSRVHGRPADAFPNSWCYGTGETYRLGAIAWMPRDVPRTNDDVVQTDELAFRFGTSAVQCRHNVAPGGGPIVAPGRRWESVQPTNGSFEQGLQGWEIGHDLPVDPNDPDEHVHASATVSTHRASHGDRSVQFTIDGVADEGTIWVQQPVDLTDVDAIAIDVYSRGESANVMTLAAVYGGPVPGPSGLTEDHFDTSRPVEGHSGWETYEYPVSHDGPGLVATGISVVWETTVTRYVDDVRLR